MDDRVAILEGSASRIQLESGRLDTIDERVVRGEPETDLLLRVSDLRVLVLARIDFRLNDDRRRPADFAGGRIDVAALPQLCFERRELGLEDGHLRRFLAHRLQALLDVAHGRMVFREDRALFLESRLQLRHSPAAKFFQVGDRTAFALHRDQNPRGFLIDRRGPAGLRRGPARALGAPRVSFVAHGLQLLD